MSTAKEIEHRIAEAEPGTVFVPSDFHDIASVDNANAVLSRMAKRGDVKRPMRGIYSKPKRIEPIGADVPPSPDAVAHAIARKNKWVIAPSGDTALNRLGLDTQVPAVYEYVSSGPYKAYEYGKFVIALKHRANRDLLDCSPVTCLVIQALKALGKEAAGDDVAKKIAARLTEDEVNQFYEETRNSTAWVFEFAKKLKGIKGC